MEKEEEETSTENAETADWNEKVKRIKAEIPKMTSSNPFQEEYPVVLLKRLIEEYPFPTDVQAYELPKFNLSPDDPNYESVKAADIRTTWTDRNTPDFLLSRLDRRVATIVQIRWDDRTRLLSLPTWEGRTNFAEDNIMFGTLGSGRCIVLVSSSGSVVGEYQRDSSIDRDRNLRYRMETLLAIRALILTRLRVSIPEFQPRHWMALQLFPEQILRTNIFLNLYQQLHGSLVNGIRAKSLFFKSGMVFVSIDEAQAVDKDYFQDAPLDAKGDSKGALRPLTVAFVQQNYGVVLSGNETHIISGIEQTDFSIGKIGSERGSVDVYAAGTTFDSTTIITAIRERGYVHGDIDPHARDLFCGRPRFAMDFLVALLQKQDWKILTERIQSDLYTTASKFGEVSAIAVSSNTKKLLPDLVFSAAEYVLKGFPQISVPGAVIEVGACSLNLPKVRQYDEEEEEEHTRHDRPAFCINEPLVVQTLERCADQLLSELTNETDARIGIKFEDYVAMHSQHLCSAIHQITLEKSAAGHAEFDLFTGPWEVPNPRGDRRRGIRCKEGMDAAALKNILRDLESDGGISLLFPFLFVIDLGPDFVAVARRATDGRFMLLFIQCKSCIKLSTAEAMDRLVRPYRAKARYAPDSSKASLKSLQEIFEREDVCVAFVVFKYPVRSQASIPEAEVVDHVLPAIEGARTIKVLKVVLDYRNAKQRLPELSKGLDILERLKLTRQQLFSDDE